VLEVQKQFPSEIQSNLATFIARVTPLAVVTLLSHLKSVKICQRHAVLE